MHPTNPYTKIITLTYMSILSNLVYLLLIIVPSPRLLEVMREERASMAVSYVEPKSSEFSAITVLFFICCRTCDEISLTPKPATLSKHLKNSFRAKIRQVQTKVIYLRVSKALSLITFEPYFLRMEPFVSHKINCSQVGRQA